jgi:hypothetical protein
MMRSRSGLEMRARPAGLGAVVALLGVTALATAAYWIVFFTSDALHVRGDAAYLAFEQAFPLADAWMASCAALGALGLWRGRPWGWLCALLAASSLVYLGCMDVLFNLNAGHYSIASGAMLAEMCINAWSLVVGLLLVAYLWSHRGALLRHRH